MEEMDKRGRVERMLMYNMRSLQGACGSKASSNSFLAISTQTKATHEHHFSRRIFDTSS